MFDKQVKDVMSKEILSARLKSTLKEISAILIKHKISAVLIRDESGNPWGVITTRDIVGSMTKPNFNDLTAEDVMTRNLVTIKPASTLLRAAKKMMEERVQRLIVAHPSHLKGQLRIVGIISMSDLVKTISEG
ncbi:MAG: CBS domain-containing protein [Candidatus Undinarchaeales archaeon]|jgi:CBS domain-containing protein|nr:CBS domain-containing protein [Candidatus Undinarchaeales archaeon]MDP7494392.1 CBS domain-containing protein [Candidatus Undinarchaeales archaeon]